MQLPPLRVLWTWRCREARTAAEAAVGAVAVAGAARSRSRFFDPRRARSDAEQRTERPPLATLCIGSARQATPTTRSAPWQRRVVVGPEKLLLATSPNAFWTLVPRVNWHGILRHGEQFCQALGGDGGGPAGADDGLICGDGASGSSSSGGGGRRHARQQYPPPPPPPHGWWVSPRTVRMTLFTLGLLLVRTADAGCCSPRHHSYSEPSFTE
jgi:hypothetical protein